MVHGFRNLPYAPQTRVFQRSAIISLLAAGFGHTSLAMLIEPPGPPQPRKDKDFRRFPSGSGGITGSRAAAKMSNP